MKQNVKISAYSFVLTIVSLLILAAIGIFSFRNGEGWIASITAVVVIIISALALFYMPLSISVNGNELCINRPIKIKTIRLNDIESVRVCSPTMAERRICGSGGWFGFWGWFYERDLGRYFAYYGRSSDCFFVRLKNGRQYMLGCKDPMPMVEFISKKIDVR